jgi:hypothetical protein
MNGVKKRLQKKYPQKPNFLLQPIQAMMKQSTTYTMAIIMALPRYIESARDQKRNGLILLMIKDAAQLAVEIFNFLQTNNLIPGAEITYHDISAG